MSGNLGMGHPRCARVVAPGARRWGWVSEKRVVWKTFWEKWSILLRSANSRRGVCSNLAMRPVKTLPPPPHQEWDQSNCVKFYCLQDFGDRFRITMLSPSQMSCLINLLCCDPHTLVWYAKGPDGIRRTFKKTVGWFFGIFDVGGSRHRPHSLRPQAQTRRQEGIGLVGCIQLSPRLNIFLRFSYV